MMADLTIVLPVYRTRAELPELHRRLRAATRDLGRVELIFVNDACPDGSLDVLQQIGQQDPDVRIVSLAKRGGQHEALCEGLAQARSETVIIMDADLQDPPEAIPALVERLRLGYGAVFAARHGRYQSTPRLWSSFVFKRLVGAITGMPHGAGAFVAMTQPVAANAAALRGTRPYLTAAIALAGQPVGSVPITRAVRASGTSAYTSVTRTTLGVRALAQSIRWRVSGAVR